MTILVAEDDPMVLDLIVRLIEREGCRVVAVMTGTDMLRAWDHGGCDAVLSDILLPGRLDGIQACRKIRERTPAAAIYLMTGDLDARRRAAKHGLEVALLKPFTPRELRAWLRRVREEAEAVGLHGGARGDCKGIAGPGGA